MDGIYNSGTQYKLKCLFLVTTLSKVKSCCILVFSRCVTNYHKFKGLKQHPFTSSQFCLYVRSLHSVAEFSAQGVKAEIKVLARLSSHLEPWRKMDFQASACLCSLAESQWGLLSVPRGHSHSLPDSVLHPQARNSFF